METNGAKWSAFLLCFALACSMPLLKPAETTKRFLHDPRGGYRFFDGFIEIRVAIGAGELHWYFKNLGREKVSMKTDLIRIRAKDHADSFGFFGERSERLNQTPSYELKSGEFMDFRFPLRPGSELLKNRFFSENEVWIEIVLNWGLKNYEYKIFFPETEKVE